MSPAAYYCWLSERRWLWTLRRRFQPKREENYPTVIAVLMPPVVTALALLLVAMLGWLATRNGFPPRLGFVYWLLGSLVFTSAAVHWGFTWLAWNQRAARLRTQKPPPSTARPGAFARWLIGPLYLLLLGVVTPVALLTAIENIRGAWRWREVRTELVDRGERLEISKVAPKSPPADQNFFATSPFNRLLEPRPAGPRAARAYTGVNADALRETEVFALPNSSLPKRDRDEAALISLADWAAALRVAVSNQAAASGSGDTRGPKYAAIPSGTNDAAVVLAATSIANAELAQICEASRRPRAVFPVAWEDGFQALIPHLSVLRSVQNLLEVRVAAKLAQGDVAGAFADAECSIHLADALREEPLLISQLVHFSQMNIAARTVWRGIVTHSWTDAQLAEFQRLFQQTDWLGCVAYALEGERSNALSTFDRWIAGGRFFGSQEADLRESEVDSDGGVPRPNLMPTGWIRQNQAALAVQYQRLLEATRRLATNPPATGYLVALEELNQITQGVPPGATAWASPYDIFVRMLMPAMSNAAIKAVRAEVTARCAATACALERYRLRTGAYPEKLAALVPDFLSAVPRDPMDNQPLRYARTTDELFRLWSVGENGRDDGGHQRRSEERKKGKGVLDWVWPYPVP
ncbi:MAG TPA: hypothetical protein PLX89_26055 [Verrucomicrobiota bacterium]|nr:hypothetical protein [Verrucomicrobiales bacterium]HRI16473.1 hypothetical protein [Verrucomicrobiota bacterium]